MTRKKTTKKKSSKRDPELAARNKRIAFVGAVLVCGGGAFVGAAMGISELDRRAGAFVVPASPSVVIQWPTNADGTIWMPRFDREDLEKLMTRAVAGGKGLSRAPLEEASLALYTTGWVNTVPRARWTSDGQIEVQAAWRVPVAAVRVGNREIIIDRDLHALPLDYATGQSNQRYFVNVDAAQPGIGQQWLGTDLQDGMELLLELEKHHLLEQIAGFDLGAGSDSGTIRIITNRGAKITWGAGPGRERPGEVPTGMKLDRLKTLFERTGLIDGGFHLIDISGLNITKMRAEG